MIPLRPEVWNVTATFPKGEKVKFERRGAKDTAVYGKLSGITEPGYYDFKAEVVGPEGKTYTVNTQPLWFINRPIFCLVSPIIPSSSEKKFKLTPLDSMLLQATRDQLTLQSKLLSNTTVFKVR